ncbi:MAG: DUF542 domain-containing protein [Myxococcales bacterium]|nr:DUF542 domain-containing protein [Myxococcales bacterium]MCB9532033.1 DUF542 domain-containing protein [Myxococcales bacterium]
MNTPKTVSESDKIGPLAGRSVVAARVFDRLGIEYCCSGDRTIGEAAKQRGLAVDLLIAELLAESELGDPATDWAGAPLAELTRHIVAAYHRPLEAELPRLVALAERVLAAHQHHDGKRLRRVRDIVVELSEELLRNMAKEERVLFPMIERGALEALGAPIRCIRSEHEEAGAALARLRTLTEDYRAPEGACATWKALWGGLERFDVDLRRHVHLENNILFPRTADPSEALSIE